MIKVNFEKKILFKKLLLISIICLTILSLIGTASAIGGNGSKDNPYTISNITDLEEFKTHYNGRYGNLTYYELTANISGNGASVDGLPEFSSRFNGNGKKISNITINPASDGVSNSIHPYSSGMFGTVAPGSTIENITFDTVSVTHSNSGQDNQTHAVGILAGTLDGDDAGVSIVIKDIHINNSTIKMKEVDNETYTGGLAGRSANTVITNVTVKNTKVISAATNGQVGGFIGYINEPDRFEDRAAKNISITNITVTGNNTSLVPASNSAGGIIGKAENVIIKDVTINGATISGNDNIGGVIGNAINSSLHSTDTNKNKIYGDVTIVGHKINDTDGGKQVGGVFGNSHDSDVLNVEITGTETTPIKITGQVGVGGVYGKTTNSGINHSSLANMSISWLNVTGNSETAAGTGCAGIEAAPSPTLITNITISDAVVNVEGAKGENIGVLFGYLKTDDNSSLMRDAIIKNCKINAPGASHVGGVAGHVNGSGKFSAKPSLGIIKIENLEIETDGTGSEVGGYLGSASGGGLEITSAELDNIKINASNETGGLIGNLSNSNTAYIGYSGSVLNSSVTVNNLEIISNENNRKDNIGGLIGNVSSGAVYIGKMDAGPNSPNPTGVTMGANVTYGGNNVGGMIGSNAANLYVENFYLNTAKLDSLDSSGALIGQTTGNITMVNVAVSGADIEGINKTSGGIGNVTGSTYVTIDEFQFENSKVTGSDDSTGGIIGYIQSSNSIIIEISNVRMNGTKPDFKIAGKDHTGGVIGYMKGTWSDFKVTVSNVTINNMTIDSGTSTGGVVGGVLDINQIDLRDITNNNMTIIATNYVGGIFGQKGIGGNNPTFKNITINDLAINGGNNVGGIAGEFRDADIENITINNITITAVDFVGGLFGTTAGKPTAPMNIGNSAKNNDVKLTGNIKINGELCVGGLVGNGKDLNITNISLTYSVTPSNEFNVNGTEYVGGLVGTCVENISITDVTVTNARVKGANNASAVVGKSLNGTFKNITVNNSYIENPGSIPEANVGGFIGYASSDNVEEIFINNLLLNSSSNNTGGVIGKMYGTNLTDIRINSSTIKGDNQTGGIVGFVTDIKEIQMAATGNSTIQNSIVIDSIITGTNNTGGFIGNQSNGNVTSSSVINSNITGEQYAGGFIGHQSNGNITSSSVIDTTGNKYVKGGEHVGGFAGQIEGNISNSSTRINVLNTNATGNFTGGFAGTLDGTVQNSFSTGNVTATSGEAGGFSGRQANNTLNCYSTGNVNGGTFGGSFAGKLTGSITNCYSTGNVTGTTAGGLVGTADAVSKITNAMALGAYVNGTTADKLVGSGSPSITNTLVWNGIKNANGEITNTKSVPTVKSYNVWDTYGKTDAGLRKTEWDITWLSQEVWKNNDLDSGYKYLLPILTWQTEVSDAPNADASHILYMTDIKIEVAEAV